MDKRQAQAEHRTCRRPRVHLHVYGGGVACGADKQDAKLLSRQKLHRRISHLQLPQRCIAISEEPFQFERVAIPKGDDVARKGPAIGEQWRTCHPRALSKCIISAPPPQTCGAASCWQRGTGTALPLPPRGRRVAARSCSNGSHATQTFCRSGRRLANISSLVFAPQQKAAGTGCAALASGTRVRPRPHMYVTAV